jgi:hypothetical protein
LLGVRLSRSSFNGVTIILIDYVDFSSGGVTWTVRSLKHLDPKFEPKLSYRSLQPLEPVDPRRIREKKENGDQSWSWFTGNEFVFKPHGTSLDLENIISLPVTEFSLYLAQQPGNVVAYSKIPTLIIREDEHVDIPRASESLNKQIAAIGFLRAISGKSRILCFYRNSIDLFLERNGLSRRA